MTSNFAQRLLAILWPIDRANSKKFSLLSLLMFTILFNQNVLRILKDSVVIPEISTEVTVFAKLCIVPVATLFLIIYTKMVNHFSFERIFVYLTLFFLAAFLLFGFVLYPNVSFFHMDRVTTERLMISYPHFKWYIAILGNWSHIFFYILSELWPNIFYILLFWQTANEVTSTEEAKRSYPTMALFGNISLMIVGATIMHISDPSSLLNSYFPEVDNNLLLIQSSIILVTIFSIISLILIRYIYKNIVPSAALYQRNKKDRMIKEKMGVIQSFKYIAKSRYLWLMLLSSAAFGLSMNLVESVWKDRMRELYPSISSYASFNGFFILWTGIAIMIMTILGNTVMRSYNWFVAAVISPIIILVTGVLFFVLVVFDHEIISLFDGAILMSPLAMAVLVGTIQNVLSKGTKYSIWDTSREMLYIPLDYELRSKGKAAVDIISSKIGKSFSSVVQVFLFSLWPSATYTSLSPALMLVFVLVCIIWIYAVYEIYKEYSLLISEENV